MKICLSTVLVFLMVNIHIDYASRCGCKVLRPCYEEMLETLLDRDETPCVENAAIGASTLLIFLKALKSFCGEVICVNHKHETYESRHLYEVIISSNKSNGKDGEKPVIILEAGQQGGSEPVGLALYVVEQLVACMEYETLIKNVKWVIMPSTNPDGQEYNRYSTVPWKRNMKPSEDQLSFGVDLTRNFDTQWASCPHPESGFSPHYPGPGPASENETIFIKDMLTKHKKDTKIYVSIRRDGHAILFPYAYTKGHSAAHAKLERVAGEVAMKVNQRTGGVHLFVNTTMYDFEEKARCGDSVDYALDSGIPLAFEMRVFLGSDNRIMSKFQTFPRGYENSLKNGYFSGIRELYSVVTNEKKYGKIV